MIIPPNTTWKDLRRELMLETVPHHAANHVLRRFAITRPPVPVEDIAKAIGLRIERVPAPGWTGAIDSRVEPPIVWVDSVDAAVRQRFTIAHELGHLFLHPLGQLFRDGTFAGTQQERDANDFAAAMLMPLWLVEPVLRSTQRKTTLASMFHVSQAAMDIQLQKLR